MVTLPPDDAGAVFGWLTALDYPWTDARRAVAGAPPLEALAPVAHYCYTPTASSPAPGWHRIRFLKYDFAAFDFDGTLADTMPWFNSVLNTVAEKYGFRQIDATEREQLRHRDPMAILKYLGIPLWKLPAIMTHMRELMRDIDPSVHLFDGMVDVLATLKAAGLRLAVVSSNSRTCSACSGRTRPRCSTTTNAVRTCSARRPRSTACCNGTGSPRNASCWWATKSATSKRRARPACGSPRWAGATTTSTLRERQPDELLLTWRNCPPS